METIEQNLQTVLKKCRRAERSFDRKEGSTKLIAVSKTFDAKTIKEALVTGHRIFGENRVQEAQEKWPQLKNEFSKVELHLIGPLQSNKAAEAVALFDVIQTVDREKIASTLAKEMQKQNKFPKLMIQVNTGSEPQKAGIEPEQAHQFIFACIEQYGLEINGLMCIPPVGENPGPHFVLLRKIAEETGLQSLDLSMGMSGDYETAIELGATYVRVGSAIFGNR